MAGQLEKEDLLGVIPVPLVVPHTHHVRDIGGEGYDLVKKYVPLRKKKDNYYIKQVEN